MNRITDTLTPSEFKSRYWLRKELVSFCREKGISTTGGKIDIADRILAFLEKGEVIKKPIPQGKTIHSKFDWKNSPLTPSTIITDNYKNTERVRAFFKLHIGEHFHFNNDFMQWMKENVGLTLHDAAVEWERFSALKKSKNYTSEIAPQFEYNQFMRDYFQANPGKTIHDAISAWKLKRGI